MRWSKLFIPTLREAPAQGDPYSRLLVRAGYARNDGQDLGYLFAGQRSLAKIGTNVRRELDAIGGQEISFDSHVAAMIGIAGGELRSYKQLPQLWYQQRGHTIEACGFGMNAAELRAAIARALASCGVPATVDDPDDDSAPEEFHTPGVKTIAEIAAFTGLPESLQIKTVVMMCGGWLMLLLLRGDHSLSEAKLRAVIQGEVRAASPEEIRERFGADPGSLGPVGLQDVRILADEALRGRRNMIGGANKTDYHLRFVTPGRDFTAEFADLRNPVEGPGQYGTPLLSEGRLLGSLKEERAEVHVLNEVGTQATLPIISIRLALDRVLRAIAALGDELGLVMPPSIAPFSVVFTPVNVRDDAQRSVAERLYEEAKAAGCDALLDDRDERPGVKFKDSELLGIPWRVTVGKKLADGLVEVFERHDKSSRDVALGSAVEFVRGRWDAIA